MNAIEKILYVIIVLLPSIALWIYINKADKEKEPKKVLIKLFCSGILAALMTLFLAFVIDLIVPGFIDYNAPASLQLFAYIFFGIALMEEVSKYATMRIFGWKDSNLNSTYDIILYSMLIALGFATFENILYAIDGNFASAITRALTAVPGHVIDGSFMGYFLCKARLAEISADKKQKNINLLLAVLIPTITHAIYDYLAMISYNVIVLILFIIFVIFEYVVSIKLIKKMSKNSKPLIEKKYYCSNCGSIIEMNFCPNCGNRRE